MVVLHGGPGAPGTVAPLARGLAGRFRVLEPWQRESGDEPLTVARHVDDLHELLEARGLAGRAGIVGHSWGAMLALAHAAAYPRDPAAVAIVGCGTFDPESREIVRRTRNSRMDEETRRRIEAAPDDGERLRIQAEVVRRVDSYDLEPGTKETFPFDLAGYEETWGDMMRLQTEGVYPKAFEAIRVPVLMLHGDADPHPGDRIRDSLVPHVRGLTYRKLDRCGHDPWFERQARESFFFVLREWLGRQLTDEGEGRGDPRGVPSS